MRLPVRCLAGALLLLALGPRDADADAVEPGPFGLTGSLESRYETLARVRSVPSEAVRIRDAVWDDGELTVELVDGVLIPLRAAKVDAPLGFWFGGVCRYAIDPTDAHERARAARRFGTEAPQGSCTELVRRGSDTDRIAALLAQGTPAKGPRSKPPEGTGDLLAHGLALERTESPTISTELLAFDLLAAHVGLGPADVPQRALRLVTAGARAGSTPSITGVGLWDTPADGGGPSSATLQVEAWSPTRGAFTEPLTRTSRPRAVPRPLELDLDMDLTPDAQPWLNVSGAAHLRWQAGEDTQRAVELHLSGPAVGVGKGHRIRAVEDAAGTPLPVLHRMGRALVVLAEPVPAGAPGEVVVRWAGPATGGRLFAGAYSPLSGVSAWPTLSAWGPVRTRIRACVPEGLGLAATGALLEESVDGGTRCARWETEVRSMYPRLAVGRWVEGEERTDSGVLLRAHVRVADAEHLPALLAEAKRATEFFEGLLGALPWSEIDFVQGPDSTRSWTASSGFIHVSNIDEFEQWMRVPLENPTARRLAHEVAHQWFGNTVLADHGESNWLSESIAEYLSMVYLRDGADLAEDAVRQRQSWWLEAGATNGAGSLLDANRVDSGVRHSILYCRGPLVMMQLAHRLGAARLHAALAVVADLDLPQRVTTRGFVAHLENETGERLGDFVETWLEGHALPVLSASIEGTWLKLVQRQGGLPFAGRVPVTMRWPNGSTMTIDLEFSAVETLVPLPDPPPTTLSIDPSRVMPWVPAPSDAPAHRRGGFLDAVTGG